MKDLLSRYFISSVLTAAMLFACSGKQGDPGPAGKNGSSPATPYINGYFRALVSGTSQNGVTFSDSIYYPYADGYESFEAVQGQLILNLYRSQFFMPTNSSGEPITSLSGSLRLSLDINNLGLPNQTVTLALSTLNFIQPLTGNNLLAIDMYQLYLLPINIVYPVDPNNTSYSLKFKKGFEAGLATDLNYVHYMGSYYLAFLAGYSVPSPLKFFTTSNDTVYYLNPVNPFIDPTASGAFIKIVNSQGISSTSSPIYEQIHVKVNEIQDFRGYPVPYFIFLDSNNNDLSKIETEPPESYTITNFNYNSSTGLLTFNFTMNSGEFSNTSGNSLSIAGKFSGLVYEVTD